MSTPTPATPEQIEAARRLYAESSSCNIEIDEDAEISDCEDGNVWVSAWVFVRAEDLEP